jgi:hypothetical protein
MKKAVIILIFFFMCCCPAFAGKKLGKLIQIVGDVDITSLTTGKKMIPEIGDYVESDHKIRTGNKSYVEILLNEGTTLMMKEISVLNIAMVKMREADPPSRIRLLTGKLRIILKSVYDETSMVVKTHTAIAGVRGTDFGIIAAQNETKIVVFEGRVEVGSENKEVIKTYVIGEKEEITVRKNLAPMPPVTVPNEMLRLWFDNYDVDERSGLIIQKQKEEGLIDKILRKKVY